MGRQGRKRSPNPRTGFFHNLPVFSSHFSVPYSSVENQCHLHRSNASARMAFNWSRRLAASCSAASSLAKSSSGSPCSSSTVCGFEVEVVAAGLDLVGRDLPGDLAFLAALALGPAPPLHARLEMLDANGLRHRGRLLPCSPNSDRVRAGPESGRRGPGQRRASGWRPVVAIEDTAQGRRRLRRPPAGLA